MSIFLRIYFTTPNIVLYKLNPSYNLILLSEVDYSWYVLFLDMFFSLQMCTFHFEGISWFEKNQTRLLSYFEGTYFLNPIVKFSHIAYEMLQVN